MASNKPEHGDKYEGCCLSARQFKAISYREAEPGNGPEQDGWCIGFWSAGDVYFDNVKYCPYCGSRLVGDDPAPRVVPISDQTLYTLRGVGKGLDKPHYMREVRDWLLSLTGVLLIDRKRILLLPPGENDG